MQAPDVTPLSSQQSHCTPLPWWLERRAQVDSSRGPRLALFVFVPQLFTLEGSVVPQQRVPAKAWGWRAIKKMRGYKRLLGLHPAAPPEWLQLIMTTGTKGTCADGATAGLHGAHTWEERSPFLQKLCTCPRAEAAQATSSCRSMIPGQTPCLLPVPGRVLLAANGD